MRIIMEDTILEMAKLMSDYADEELCGDFGEFIYFSPSQDSHGPRVKFYGGTKETSKTKKAPSLAFTNLGKTELILQPWMDKKNCPNAFDKEYVEKVHNFIQRTLPILLLVWYDKLDESRALKYFEGSLPIDKLLSYCTDIKEDNLRKIKSFTDLKELHKFCLKNSVYKFGK